MNETLKLNEDVLEKMVGLIREEGLDVTSVCERCDVARPTFYSWLKQGEEAEPGTLLFRFYYQINAARLEAERLELERRYESLNDWLEEAVEEHEA